MKKEQGHIDDAFLLKIIGQTANEVEQALFKTWHEASAENAQRFEQLQKIWQVTSIDPEVLKKNWESVVRKKESGIEVPSYIELPGTAQSFLIKILRNDLMRVAAAILLLAGISFLLKMLVFNPVQLTILGNDRNPKDPYQLADGSLVYLNENSEISFSKTFGKQDRKLSLKGEAFFEVQRNEKIPFVISTYKTTTEVLGTKFNIYSDQSKQVRVTVVSGLVAFSSPASQQEVKLAAGEKGFYSPGMTSIEKVKNDNPNFLAWKTGVLKFDATPLPQAFTLLQKQYSHVFVFKAKKTEMPTLTTTIDNMPLEAVLEELNLLLNTKNEMNHDTIVFIPGN